MFYRNPAMHRRRNYLVKHCGLAAVLSLSLSLYNCATVSAQTLTYKTSWFGNSGGTEANHIMQSVDSFFVSNDGKLYGATYFEEGGSNVLVFSQTDGSILCRPYESGTGSWGKQSQGVATGDGTYVYQAMSQDGGYDGSVANGSGGVRYPATGSKWQVIRRYKLSDGYGASFTGGNGSDGSYLVVATGSTAKAVVGLAVSNGEIYAADSQTNTIRVYNATTMSATPVRSWAVTDPGKIQVDSAGFIWMLQPTNKKLVRYSNTGVLQSQSVTFAAAVVPLGFGIDTTQNRILVANDGVDQNILIYNNILTSPGANGTFGTTGGIYFGTGAQIGLVGPRLFNGPVGVGADSSGNIYVACDASGSGGGTVIEKYDSLGNLVWNKIGLEFVDGGDTAPSSETDVYTKEEHFVMDYIQTAAGTEATYKGYTLNRFKYPNDPRLHDTNQHHASPMIREMDSKRFLFISNMYGDPPSIYRFNSATDGETAIPSVYFGSTGGWSDWMPTRPASGDWNWRDLNGNGNFDSNEFTQPSAAFTFGKWSVDTRGDIWVTSNDAVKTISKIPYGGLDSVGNPIYDYSARVSTTAPSIFTELCRIEYEPATDTMWVAGYTTTNTNQSTQYWGQIGREIVRYNNWSTGNRTANLRITIPYDVQSNPAVTIKAMALAGDYVFAVEARLAIIHVYNRDTGVKVGIISPGPEVGSKSGWVDVDHGIRVKHRSNGEYLIFVEEDGFGKVMMYRWAPAGITPPATGTGTITREIWTNIPGTAITGIPQTAPQSTGTLTSMEIPMNTADNYGTRLRGYITAPLTGAYTFWIAGDDNCELLLSTNDQPGNKVSIASVGDWTNSREWNKYPSQKSGVRNLIAGNRYYVEVLHKEGGGGDNLAVGWLKPGQSGTSPSEVIPGSQLSPFSGGTSPVSQLLSMGTIIGTTGSHDGVSTREKAFDGNTGTIFDGPTASGCWAGRDLGSGTTRRITQVKYYPRTGLESRMTGGSFQGSNDGSSWTTLHTIPGTPATNAWTSVNITNTASWRYLRYLSPNGSYGNVAEVEFYGQ